MVIAKRTGTRLHMGLNCYKKVIDPIPQNFKPQKVFTIHSILSQCTHCFAFSVYSILGLYLVRSGGFRVVSVVSIETPFAPR